MKAYTSQKPHTARDTYTPCSSVSSLFGSPQNQRSHHRQMTLPSEGLDRYKEWDNRMIGEIKRSVDASMRGLRVDSSQRSLTDSSGRVSAAKTCDSTPKKAKKVNTKAISHIPVQEILNERAKKLINPISINPISMEDSAALSTTSRMRDEEHSDYGITSPILKEPDIIPYYMKAEFEHDEKDKGKKLEKEFSFGKEGRRNRDGDPNDTKGSIKQSYTQNSVELSFNMGSMDVFLEENLDSSKIFRPSKSNNELKRQKENERELELYLQKTLAEREVQGYQHEIQRLKNELAGRDHQINDLITLVMSLDRHLGKAAQLYSKEAKVMNALRQTIYNGLKKITGPQKAVKKYS